MNKSRSPRERALRADPERMPVAVSMFRVYGSIGTGWHADVATSDLHRCRSQRVTRWCNLQILEVLTL